MFFKDHPAISTPVSFSFDVSVIFTTPLEQWTIMWRMVDLYNSTRFKVTNTFSHKDHKLSLRLIITMSSKVSRKVESLICRILSTLHSPLSTASGSHLFTNTEIYRGRLTPSSWLKPRTWCEATTTATRFNMHDIYNIFISFQHRVVRGASNKTTNEEDKLLHLYYQLPCLKRLYMWRISNDIIYR